MSGAVIGSFLDLYHAEGRLAVGVGVPVDLLHHHRVHDDREFSGNGHGCFLSGRTSSACSELEPPVPNGAGFAEGPEHVLRGADEQASDVAVAAFGDRELRVGRTRLVFAGAQAEVGAHLAAVAEAVWIADGGDKAQGRQRPDAGNLTQELRVSVALCSTSIRIVHRRQLDFDILVS